jgi:hypothetical protein
MFHSDVAARENFGWLYGGYPDMPISILQTYAPNILKSARQHIKSLDEKIV